MLINGLKSNDINAADRGLAYGDGLFSTIKIESGHVVDWTLHLERLKEGAQRLFFPQVDWLQLQQEIFDSAETIKAHPHYVLKVILTRGSGGRGYSAQGCEQPTRIISLSAFPEMYFQWQKNGIAIVQCETQLGRNKQLAGLKSLARLEQVLIKQELASKGALEGLVCDEFGHVIEACSANIFVFLNGHWITPKLDYCGVAGVMRKRILKHASIDVTEQNITVNDIKQASSIFLSNALMGIVPIVQYEDKRYSTEQLQRIIELQRLLVSKDD
ncbi:aminodeoxychorismate lyase [Psychromonas sp.]|nr:aminodeoxychorismate lyase [Psychromonas sp.]